MNEQEFKDRTKRFAVRIIKLVEALPSRRAAQIVGGQLLRCGTSVGANYRAACRAKSTADIIHNLSIVEEEADEALFWMELLSEAELMRKGRLEGLMAEANEIIAMIVASIKTLRRKQQGRNTKSKI